MVRYFLKGEQTQGGRGRWFCMLIHIHHVQSVTLNSFAEWEKARVAEFQGGSRKDRVPDAGKVQLRMEPASEWGQQAGVPHSAMFLLLCLHSGGLCSCMTRRAAAGHELWRGSFHYYIIHLICAV